MQQERQLQRHQLLETLREVPWTSSLSWSLAVKRGFDYLAALLLILLLSPLFLVIALGIKVSSRGPVFYIRPRLGKGRVPFAMWKFRTMNPQAEKWEKELLPRHSYGPFFKVMDDRRIFPFGRFLRKYSLDELPQLFNVLKGDMSLVGPRPIFDFEAEEFRRWEQLRRFQMKPGITGLWQVSGRSDTSAATRMALDAQYISEWSLTLDFKILLSTIPAVVGSKGAV